MPSLWVLFGVVCAFWFVYLIRPFSSRSGPADDRHRHLLEDKRGLLFALRDAEVDFHAGKLSAADYEQVRDKLETQAAEVIRALDEMGGGTTEDRVTAALDTMRSRGQS